MYITYVFYIKDLGNQLKKILYIQSDIQIYVKLYEPRQQTPQYLRLLFQTRCLTLVSHSIEKVRREDQGSIKNCKHPISNKD